MSLVTIIWSMTAAACLTLACVYLFVWIGQRDQFAHLAFSVVALGVAAFAAGEFGMMVSTSPSQFGHVLRWIQVPAWLIVAGLVWLTRTYLHAGRPWLGWTVLAVRTLSLLINFALPGNITYREITALRHVHFLDEPVSLAVARPNPLMVLPHASVLLLLVFIIDAGVKVWRQGERRRALIVAGSMVVFTAQALFQIVLVLWGIIPLPLCVSLGYLIMLIAMAYELSRDILHGARLARELHEVEERTGLAVKAADLGFWSWDRFQHEVWATDRARTHFGQPEQAPLAMRRVLEAVHAEDRDLVGRAVEKAVLNRGEFDVECRIPGGSGEVRWVAARGSAEASNRHGVVLRGVTMDITQRKRDAERLQLTMEAIPSAAVVVDRRRRIVLANSKAEELFGMVHDELLGQDVDRLVLQSNPEVVAGPGDSHAMRNGQDVSVRRKDGSELPAEVRFNLIPTEEGLVLLAIVDISARREAESELAQLREGLSHAGRVSMMGQLASSLAHEINQPLGAILRNAEAAELVLNQDPPDLDELRAIVADIQADDHRAGEVIDGLRSLLKRRHVQMQPLSVESLVNQTAALIRPYAIGLKVAISVGTLPESLSVQGDRIHLQQVLLNLLMNGIHAVKEQEPDRRVVRVDADRNDSHMVRISVIDRGCGIPDERMPRIFDPFFTTKDDGMGMGLSIARTVVEAHRGRIWAEPTQGGGTTFHLTLVKSEGAATT